MSALSGRRVWAHTLGCRINQYDTEAMLEGLEAAGCSRVAEADSADIILINSCTVTAEADRKSRQMLRRYVGAGKTLVAAGCLAQRAAEELAAIPGVCIVVGTRNRLELLDKLQKWYETGIPQTAVELLTRREAYEPLWAKSSPEHTRANLKVQEGCDRFCTYCIIPYVRGGLRSRPIADAVEEAAVLAASGIPEVVLTGIHLASYGKDWGGEPSLIDLLEALDRVPRLERIRLGSLEPSLLTEDFCRRAAKLTHLCPHFHISLQSGCDATLKRMGRRYSCEEFRGYVRNLRATIPDCTLATDMIVGFPGETVEDFLASRDFAREIAFDTIHVFPYSPREGTPAARMVQTVSKADKHKRARALMDTAAELQQEALRRLQDCRVQVLIEELDDAGYGLGYTPAYHRVACPAAADDVGRILPVILRELKDSTWIGERVLPER